MDASDFGRYGTLCLLKRHEPDTIVAPYPIDDPEVTLGRDASCSIRLYYAEVSAVHCKVVFNDEGKAFVVVLGTNGLLIDDCPVYPSPAGGAPATVPLPNNSILEVHKKRFRFAYPPKHLRTTLAAIPPTPIASPGARRRALRMSMITSAKVFSPRPFEDPRRNLEVLQSPLKAVFKPEPDDEEDDEDKQADENQSDDGVNAEDIILVESDHPRVVESEKDLVILDHIIVTEPPASATTSPYRSSSYASPVRANNMPVPPQNWGPPRTPARRMPRASLHRAVLIRSAQKAALRHEMQREEEMDAEEVESIMGEDGEVNDAQIMEDLEEEYEESEVEVKEEEQQRRTPMSGWRKSLEAVKGGLGWAFRAASVEAEERTGEDTLHEEPRSAEDVHGDVYEQGMQYEQVEVQYPEHDYESSNEEQNHMEADDMETTENIYPNLQDMLQEQPQAGPSTPEPSAAPLRPLGRFMTPQASSAFPRPPAQGRFSIGGPATNTLESSTFGPGVGPRRVRLVEPWKVSDIVMPIREEEVKKEEEVVKQERAQSLAPTNTPRRDRVSEEEKRAIRERRKSALNTPDNFFNGQAPGFRRTPAASSAPLPALFPAAQNTSPKKEHGATLKTEDDASTGSEEDAGVLLARMRQMVEGVRRRQSMESSTGETPRRKSLSPRKRSGFSLLAPEPGAHRQGEDAIMEEQEDVDENAGTGNQTDGAVLPVLTAPKQSGTPQMNDLRHLFAVPGPSATPQLTGVRKMFLGQKKTIGMEDAALEGVGEMMVTPAGWRSKSAAHAQDPIEANEDDAAEEEVAPVVPSRNTKGKGVAPRRTPRSVTTQKETPVSNLGTVNEDDAAISTEVRPSVARVVRRARTRTAESDQEATGTSVPRTVRSRHARAEEEDEVPELPSRAKSAARKKPGTASDVSEGEAGTNSSKPLRRSTRAASAEPEVARKTPASATTSARRTRAARTPVTEDPVAPVPKSNTTRRGARGKANEAPVADNDDDPLDSLAREESAPAAAKVRRAGRSRIPVGSVKQEDDSPAIPPASDDESAAPPARNARGRKAAGTSKPTASTSAAKSTARSRTTASSKKPMAEIPNSGKSTPSTGEEEEGSVGDKENTPEPQTEDDAPPVAAPVKTKGKSLPASGSRSKGTRSATKARGGTEEPVVSNEGGVAKTRVSRKRVTTAGKS